MLAKLLGTALILIGLYFLGQNIFFTTRTNYYWYTGLAADGCVISGLAGLLLLILGGPAFRPIAWFCIALSVALVFISSRVVLEPTTLWEFFVSFGCIAAGLRLTSKGKIDFL